MNIGISISEYIDGINTGKFTVQEFMIKTLDHIKQQDPNLHAFVRIYDDVMQQAKKIDDKIKSTSKLGKCLGMPISIKDNICIQGKPTTCCSEMLSGFVSSFDATVIKRLRLEDSIFIGNTNMDEFAMGLTTEFSCFGPSKNPHNTNYVPGGSSGGSAVAVSSDMCVASFGSDTGGSVRNPASFCSVVGYKPTYGLVSRFGLISYANSIEQIGPLTKTVKDTAFMLNIISGTDSNDHTTIPKVQNYLDGIDDGIEGKKIGILSTDDGYDNQVVSSVKDAISGLTKLGAQCQEISLEMSKYSVASYYTITSTEAASNLARFDNIRYGYDFDSLGIEFNSYISQARKKFGPEVTRRMILGGFVPSAGQAGKYYLKALKVKNALSVELRKMFETVDYILSPTVPVLPFKLGSIINDPIALFLIDLNTVYANLSGCPAISVPFNMSSESLPIGMQLMGSYNSDASLLQAAQSLENISKVKKW